MNKIAMYEALLEDHPLWAKEASIFGNIARLGTKARVGIRQAGRNAGILKKPVVPTRASIGGKAKPLKLRSLLDSKSGLLQSASFRKGLPRA